MTNREMLNTLHNFFMEINEDAINTLSESCGEGQEVTLEEVFAYIDGELAKMDKKAESDRKRRENKKIEYADFDNRVLELLKSAGDEGITNADIALTLSDKDAGEFVTASKVSASIKRLSDEYEIEKAKINNKTAYVLK